MNPFSLILGPVPFSLTLARKCPLVMWFDGEDKMSTRRISMRAPYRIVGRGLWEQEEAGELTLLWDWEAFPAEVTFELGHLVFCRAAARFCLV